MHRVRRSRVELEEKRVRGLRVRVVQGLGAPPLRRLNCRRDLEIGESGTEVEAGPSRDDSRVMAPHEVVDALVGEVGVLADGHRVSEIANGDERRGLGGLVREDGQAPVHLQRVGRDDVRAELVRDAPCDDGLPGGGRSEDRDDFVPQSGHFTWGTPAHHPLQA